MAAAVARHAGARYVVVTDDNEYRLNLARNMGATVALNGIRERVRGNDVGILEGIYVIGFSYPVVPQGQGSNPHSDLSRAYPRRSRPRAEGVRCGKSPVLGRNADRGGASQLWSCTRRLKGLKIYWHPPSNWVSWPLIFRTSYTHGT